MQLPPTVRSTEAMRRGLGMSLFERVMRKYECSVAQQLTCQFRMHGDIMAWSNSVFYGGSLVAAACVERRLLCDTYPNIPPDVVPSVLWIDTAGVSWMREDEVETQELPSLTLNRSRSNRAEAALVLKYLQELVQVYSVRAADVGVITPYSAQAKLIRQLILDLEEKSESGEGGDLREVTVQTVDGFQGREREVIIISLVRSNRHKEMGFLVDARRLNVAVTRARSHLVIVGDSETVTSAVATAKKTAVDGTQHGQLEPDARKALTALFETASLCGSLRTPYEFIGPSDIPAVASHRSAAAGRMEPKTPQGREQRGSKNPKTPSERSSEALVKTTKDTRRSRGQGVAASTTTTPVPSTAKLPGSLDPETQPPADDPFVIETREKLDALCRRGDGSQASASAVSYTHAFPPTLSPYQRLIVHRLAEELQLVHISKGEGAERFIEVCVQPPPSERQPSPVPQCSTSVSVAGAKGDHSTASGHADLLAAQISTNKPSPADGEQDMSPRSLEAASFVCEKSKTEAEKPSSVSKKNKKKSTSKGSAKVTAEGEESDDLDALLEEHLAAAKRCSVGGCKDSTDLLGRTCPYCRSRFCLRHALPEVHGCGDAAAAEAKKAFRAEGKNNIRLMRHAKEGTVGTRAATIAGTVFVNPSVGGSSQMREALKSNLRKNIEEKAKDRISRKSTKRGK
ncbi:r3h domain-containing protein [Cyclospora cayetanensis]|uniref:R3h domain-containing protein n=1 Tax=Cyclospora cayetanensis TaxID=88456 RepID=A0A1D3D0P2_9EIME|nr:r3h domain-containing protein [Cyclospora cayetanensis]